MTHRRVWMVFCASVAVACVTEPESLDVVIEVVPSAHTFEWFGDTVRIQADVTASDGSSLVAPTIEWTSDRPDVAFVDPTGLVRSVGPGEATITARVVDARASNDATADARIGVEECDTVLCRPVFAAVQRTDSVVYGIDPDEHFRGRR
jgi:hypothetical protein